VQRGNITLGGMELSASTVAQRSEHVMYMPQDFPSAVHLTVFESILVAAQVNTKNKRTQTLFDRVNQLLLRLGITHLAQKYLNKLSGGQRQLVGLAQALVRRPTLLLLDEPLSALDLNYQFHVMALLRHETQTQGLITVVVLHDLNTALNHTDHTLLLHQGKIAAQGLPADVITPDNLATVYGVRGSLVPSVDGRYHVHVAGLVHNPLLDGAVIAA
jgi:iron complex transport system ATP-binding protein